MGMHQLTFLDGSSVARIASTSQPFPVTIISGASSGTEYTEDAAAAANPVGGMLIARRKDTLSATEVSADGDNIALNATNKGELYVSDTQLVAIGTDVDTLAGTVSGGAVSVTQAALSDVDKPLVAGTIAHDSADSGNPVKVGFKALSASPTAVTANDRVNANANLLGNQIVQPYAHEASWISGTTSAITDTTTTQVIDGGGGSLKLYITSLTVQNSDATVGTWVVLEEETSGTNLWQVYAAALGGGAVVEFPTPLKVPTADKGLYALCETTSAEVRVSAAGYYAP